MANIYNCLAKIFWEEKNQINMTSALSLIIPAAIAIIIFVVVFLLIATFSGRIEKQVEPLFGKYLNYLEQEFSVLDIPMTARRFMLFQIGFALCLFVVGFIIGVSILSKLFIGTLLAIIAFVLSRLYITRMKNKRKQMFEEQFVDAISLIANGVRSGLSLMQALELTIKEMNDPISYEINLVVQATRVGVPLDIALHEWSARMDSNDLEIFTTAVIIQSQTGGNLSEVLETLGNTIRERFKIQRQIKTLTSQGVMSAYILTFLPVVLGIILYFIQPAKMSLLFTTNYGLMLSLSIIALISTGGFMVKKIITIDV